MDTKYPFGYKQGKVIYTFIDDATRFVYAYAYESANQHNTIDFLSRVIERTPFVICKIRMDQGREFIATSVHAYILQNTTSPTDTTLPTAQKRTERENDSIARSMRRRLRMGSHQMTQ